MKNIFFFVLAIFSLTSCGDDTNLPAPYYSIEGKWIWSPSDNRADANTMYEFVDGCLLYTSPSPRDRQKSRMPSSA